LVANSSLVFILSINAFANSMLTLLPPLTLMCEYKPSSCNALAGPRFVRLLPLCPMLRPLPYKKPRSTYATDSIIRSFGNPAISWMPVTFRPTIACGLALNSLKHIWEPSEGNVKEYLWVGEEVISCCLPFEIKQFLQG
jgi:hypothetical protein